MSANGAHHAHANVPSLASARSKMPSFISVVAAISKYEEWVARARDRGIETSDLMFGNPNEPPSQTLLAALKTGPLHSDEPLTRNTFSYNTTFVKERKALCEELFQRRGVRFAMEDVSLCNAALSGLTVVLQALTDPGDEVIVVTPLYFFYGAMLDLAGAVRVAVPVRSDFDLDVDAIRAAITPRTRVVMINSPNNPSGRIYPPETLRQLGEMLTAVNIDRPIALISDEAYCRIVYDGTRFRSPTEFYPWSVLVYTFGKSTLVPSERLGFIALSPLMPPSAAEQLRTAIRKIQISGFAYPNRTTAETLPALLGYTIDVEALQRRRDLLADALEKDGWTLHRPQGTFYMMIKVPDGFDDDYAFVDVLGEEGVFVLAGSLSDLPGWFRVSVTGSDEMVERAIPILERVKQAAEQTRK